MNFYSIHLDGKELTELESFFEKFPIGCEYDEEIARFLKERCVNKSAHYIEMGNGKHELAQWNIQEMSKLPYFITAIGEELDIDISKPLAAFPKETTTLYNYEGDF